jgi:hypothetical protein
MRKDMVFLLDARRPGYVAAGPPAFRFLRWNLRRLRPASTSFLGAAL